MMKTTMIAAAAWAALGLVGQAQAQGSPANACLGRVVIDTIYQSGTGGNNYEYFLHLRNATRTSIMADVSFSGFPGTVTLFSPSLPGIPIGANATRSSLKFGRGTWGQLSTGTVARVYDVGAGSGPTVRVSNCRAG